MDDKKISVVILLHKCLENWRVHSACDLCENELPLQRSQAYCVSELHPLTVGVPQGSIHGPVLLIVKAMDYVDDNKSNVFKSLSIYSKLEKILVTEELQIS